MLKPWPKLYSNFVYIVQNFVSTSLNYLSNLEKILSKKIFTALDVTIGWTPTPNPAPVVVKELSLIHSTRVQSLDFSSLESKLLRRSWFKIFERCSGCEF